ncbi:hypothetical protein OSB04_005517 [Centaurea solstitialis]|uniref:Cytochrome P450 n=1 Tax=Centaurea solstitialis TaxID=347529 RepID=A0AA38WGV3_9ASTR|nr:hypothetical protein OSB04_005517 [Centaurea solstitialis]
MNSNNSFFESSLGNVICNAYGYRCRNQLYTSITTTIKNPPPSPPKLPIIGNIHQLGPLIHRSFSSLSRRYGGRHLMLLHLGSVPSLVVSSAAAAQEITQTHDLIFASRPPMKIYNILFNDLKEISAAPYGEYFRHAKKLMVLNFLSTKKVQKNRAFRDEEIAITLRKITEISERKSTMNVGDLLHEHSNRVSCMSTFGMRYDVENSRKLKKITTKLFEVLNHFYYADSTPALGWIDWISGANSRLKGFVKELDELMEATVEERVAGRRKTDGGGGGGGDGDVEPFIDALIRIQKDEVDGNSLDRGVVKALIMTYVCTQDAYFAGTETMASTLQWIMAELLTHPQILKKAQAEVRKIVDGKQHITDEDLEKMEYMKAIITETSRLHPPIPVPVPRFATEDVNIMGYNVSKGTTVYINIWAIGRDPEVWDRPDEFLPERFMEASLDDFKLIFPFGGGRRGCPGKGFAMAVVESLLANLLWKFDWELKDKEGSYPRPHWAHTNPRQFWPEARLLKHAARGRSPRTSKMRPPGLELGIPSFSPLWEKLFATPMAIDVKISCKNVQIVDSSYRILNITFESYPRPHWAHTNPRQFWPEARLLKHAARGRSPPGGNLEENNSFFESSLGNVICNAYGYRCRNQLYTSITTTIKNPPPSPPKLPIIGNIHQLGPLIHRSFSSLSRRYGGRHLMLLHLGSVPSLVVSSAAAAQEITQTHDLIFASRPPMKIYNILFNDLKEISAAPYGEYFRHAKKLMVLNFLSTKKVQKNRAFRDEEIAITLRKITEISERKSTMNVGDLLHEHSNRVSCMSTFGMRYDVENSRKLKKITTKLFEVLNHFYYADSTPALGWIDWISGANSRLKGFVKELDELMEATVEERVAGRRKTDGGGGGGGDGDVEPFIDALIRIQKDEVDGNSLDRGVVKALIMTYVCTQDAYFAGTETMASTLQWIMAELLTHPQILKKAQAEVRKIVDGKQHITDEDLEKMEYMKAIITETSRLHPPIPVPVPRFATEDVNIMGYNVSKGTTVYINIWAIGRDPEVWDRPDEFLPERFMEASLDDFKLIFPFGGGRRGCPGKGFAMAVVESLLANLLWKFDWELKDKEGVNMDEPVIPDHIGPTLILGNFGRSPTAKACSPGSKPPYIQNASPGLELGIPSFSPLWEKLFATPMAIDLYTSTTNTTKNPAPSPPKLPIIGNIHQLGPLIHRSFSSLSRRYGGQHLMLLHLGSVPSLVVSSAAAAQEITQTHDLIFASRPPMKIYNILFNDLKEISAAPYGEYFRHAKKLMVLNFLSTKKVQKNRAFRDEEIAITLRKITEISERKSTMNVGDLLHEHSNRVSCMSTFGMRYDVENSRKLKKITTKLFEVLNHFYYADSTPALGWIDWISGANSRLKGFVKELDELMEATVEERVAGRRKTDGGGGGDGDVEPFIDALIRIQKDGVDGISLDRGVVKALIMDAYFAGTETMASTLQWIMAELLTHPQILKKAQAEVRKIVDGKQHIMDEDLEKMKYMKSIITETSRLHPPIPVPVPRFATEDVKIMGYNVSKGTTVYINIWAIGRDPEVWDRPDEFLPERFMEASVDDFKLIFPFGGGRRGCPGKGFAMAVVESLLANLLWKFDWELKDKEGVNMDETVDNVDPVFLRLCEIPMILYLSSVKYLALLKDEVHYFSDSSSLTVWAISDC